MKYPGVSELLELLGTIIPGFAMPLKTKHKTYLRRALIPLHRAKSLATFHAHLTHCEIEVYVRTSASSPNTLDCSIRKFLFYFATRIARPLHRKCQSPIHTSRNRWCYLRTGSRRPFQNQKMPGSNQYLEKAPSLAQDMIEALIKYWPVSLTSKQVGK
jgi:hypothetical protein